MDVEHAHGEECQRDALFMVMRRVKPYVIFVVVVLFMTWNLLTYYVLMTKPSASLKVPVIDNVQTRLDSLQAEILLHIENNKKLLNEINKFRHKSDRDSKSNETLRVAPSGHSTAQRGVDDDRTRRGGQPTVIPVLVIACDRITVSRCLDQLIKYRSSKEQFPIVVSQDCGHSKTAAVIASYGDKVTHIMHPNITDISLPWPQKKFKGYYKISRHYKWALQKIFHTFNYSSAIIVEDDLDISPDFFEYFSATHRLLQTDPSLWCVSAWNDNGKANLIEDKANLLYRTDFFPGLGWMLERKTFLELEPKWPNTFWDDWMRHPDQRKARACIRPEISRTSTFGKIGVSKGQFFEKHLKYIKLNEHFIPFTKTDLSYLSKENYDLTFSNLVYGSPLLTLPEVLDGARPDARTVRIEYTSKADFVALAKKLGIMDDIKAGVPRTGYRGVATVMYSSRRVFIAPPPNWSHYDPSW